MKKYESITRRTFVKSSVAGATSLALMPLSSIIAGTKPPKSVWPKDASRYKFYMIGHGHLDPVWLWPWHEGISIVHSTFRSALDRMKEMPDVVFSATSTQFYQWVADNDPQMLDEIRKRVEEGRWNVVGGWWVEPDVNIPSGEALVRQGLYGQLTLQRLVGVRAKVAFNPDSFGHAGTLPQIISLQGMNNYAFTRPSREDKNLPADLFWWEGPDGTRILANRIRHYGGGVDQIKTILEQRTQQPMKSFMVFFGAGDHGGGPTKSLIESIENLKKDNSAPKILYSSLDRYFNDMREDKTLNLPVVKDDMQYFGVGCYTAESAIKKENRQSEAALVNAEKVAAIGSFAWAAHYPKNELTNAWKRVLFLQFHDSLAGTSLLSHSKTAKEGYGFAMDTANQTLYLAVQKLEWQIPAEDPESRYILIFNPHAWEVNEFIEYELGFFEDPSISKCVEDEQGRSLPYQRGVFGACEFFDRHILTVRTTIPPMGYRQLRIRAGEPARVEHQVSVTGNNMENKFLKVSFSQNGSISIFDKKAEKNVFDEVAGGCRAVILDDPSDPWSVGVASYTNEIGEFGNASFSVIESGPMRAIVRVRTSHNQSSLIIDWLLYADSKHIEARVTLDWHEQHKMLKFSFPVNLDSSVATLEIPYGHIVRQANGNELPGQRWINLSGKSGGYDYGFTVINDAKYGYDITGNDMRLSVARSAIYSHWRGSREIDIQNREYLWMDQGIQTFKLKLVPHQGDWKEINIPRIAEEFLTPSTVIYQGIHDGIMPKSGSYINVDAENIIISSVKLSEERNDLIIRCVETFGKPFTATVDIRIFNRKWTGSFKPCEIKTLRLNRNSKDIVEVNLLEE